MAAVIGSVPVSRSAHGSQRIRLGSVEPAVLVLLKLLDPLVAVAMLGICVRVLGIQASPTHLGVLVALTILVCGRVFSHSGSDLESEGQSPTSAFSRITVQWSVVVSILMFAGLVLKAQPNEFWRHTMLAWFIVTPFALYGSRALRLHARSLISNGAHAPRYIIVGANPVGYELFRRLPKNGFLGFFDFRNLERVTSVIDPAQLVGHCKDVAEFARTHAISSIYIALPLSNVPRIGDMVEALRDTTASIYFVPDVFAFDPIQGRVVEISGMPALSVCDTPFYGMDAVLKRTTDLAFAGFALLMLAPLMLLIAACVKATSKGPALFRQRRYGLNGEEITVYKFRSMTVCEDGAVVTQATKEDVRVTAVGKFLRATSLDELPQLLNVIQGKMSVVGPRPHAVAHNELYRKLISGYMIRHKVRPGITGLAQVSGLRGETATVDRMRERVRYDLEYLRHWSPWLDFKIVLKTIWVVVRDKNAY